MLRPTALFMASLIAVSLQAAQTCPVTIEKVDPDGYPPFLGDSDPWHHYLQIHYTNHADRPTRAVEFGVYFVDPMREANRSVYDYVDQTSTKPGHAKKPSWGDGVYYHEYGRNMGAMAWIIKIRFLDETVWADDGSKSCGTVRFVQAEPYKQTPTVPQAPSSQSGVDSLRSAVDATIPSPSSGPSPQDPRIQLIKEGKASLATVVTIPRGAIVSIEGKIAGPTPVWFVLLRKPDDSERTVTITMKGYKDIQRKYKPDGTPIYLILTLEPDDTPQPTPQESK